MVTAAKSPSRLKRVVVAIVALTIVVLLLDLAKPSWTQPVRGAAAVVFTPIQQAIRGWSEDDLDEVRAQRDALAVEIELLRLQGEAETGGEDFALPDSAAQWQGLGARVIAVSPPTAPAGERVVTIDVGSRDGVAPDRSVLNTFGLVGRVLRVYESSADVLLISDPSAVVGVRFGADGALGAVSAQAPPELGPRPGDALTLTGVGDAAIEVGDDVRTLGSPDGSPFVADIAVGTVTEVDQDAGQLSRTAIVAPAVEVATLDAVVVLVERDDP